MIQAAAHAVMPPDARPACATIEGRELVDAAFEKPGGQEAARLTEQFCHGCPVRQECFAGAMRGAEHGPWAGTTRKKRGRGRGWHPAENLKEIHRRGATPTDFAG